MASDQSKFQTENQVSICHNIEKTYQKSSIYKPPVVKKRHAKTPLIASHFAKKIYQKLHRQTPVADLNFRTEILNRLISQSLKMLTGRPAIPVIRSQGGRAA